MNTSAIKRRLRACKGCNYFCTGCPHALPCERQGQKVRPTECYVCWHNQGTMLLKDCRVSRTPVRTKVHA